MSGVVLDRLEQLEQSERMAPTSWTRSTVHDFFRKTNWDNRPIEPPRVQKISPHERTVSQFFQGVDWQWVAPVRSASLSPGESSIGDALFDLETTQPGPDGSGPMGSSEADDGLTLDGFTDLF